MKGKQSNAISEGISISEQIFAVRRGFGWTGGMLRSVRHLALAIILILVSVLHIKAAAEEVKKKNLDEMSIDELMKIPVTIASRKAEEVSKIPAAIYVVTQDDIRRSGARNIPEALRLVPGLDVAQVDSQQWAISARGFNDTFANKLLVLQDGRSLYTPLFSGVFWDAQDTLLEDIDRIEVVRGPGATLWGANAVNGVINIITKSAKDTQGLLITGGVGTEERAFTSVRYGDKFGEDLYFRVYAKYFDRDASVYPNGSKAHDGWDTVQGGFRIDWDKWEKNMNLVTVQGDIYEGWHDQTFRVFQPSNPPFYTGVVQDSFKVAGGNVLGRWTHGFSDSAEMKLQLYYDRTERDTRIFNEDQDTFDVDLQHHFEIGDRNDLVVGAGYRLCADKIGNTLDISFEPTRKTTQLASAFLQDEVTLVEKKLGLTVGAKFEHNDYTGFEFQPSVRLLWTPLEKHTFWASVARAVRTPSRAEENIKLTNIIPPDGLFPGSPAAAGVIYGSELFESEKLTAYELGWRARPCESLSLELATFYNVYDDLRSIEAGPSPTQPVTGPPPPPGIVLPTHIDNQIFGETYGFELSSTVQLADWWRIQPSYGLLQMQLHKRPGSTDTISEADEGRSPQQQVLIRSSMDFPHDLAFDCIFRYVDRLPALEIKSYVAMDLRLGWRPTKHLELAVVGQNLLSSHHGEFAPTFINTLRSDVERSVYGKIILRF